MSNGELYLNDLWNNTLKSVSESKEVDEQVFDMYFNGSKLHSLSEDSALVVAPTFLHYCFLIDYRTLLESCLEDVLHRHTPITVIEKKDLEEMNKPKDDTFNPIKNPFFNQALDSSHTFANFVTGKSNAQAHIAAFTVAANPGLMYNPLFIYGSSGIGKTHLLNAIGNAIKEQFPEKKICYITGDGFVDDVYLASKNKLYDELKASFKDLDLLLVDDIQFLADKPKSHEIFFNIFNHLVSNKKQICVTSDRSPEDIKGLESRLITRFNQGLTVSISAPEYETACNILKLKINNNVSISQQIDDDVISYIATNFSQDVRSLEGALNRLLFYSVQFSDDKEHITLKLAMEAFKDQILSNKDVLTYNKIKKAVVDYYNITKEQLISKNKTKNIVNARHIAIYLCRKLLDEPYDSIGKEFGKRDHSTIMNSCERVESFIKSDPLYLKVVQDIEKKLTV